MKLQGTGGDGTLRTFVIRTACQCYCGDHIKKKNCVGIWQVWGRCKGILWFVMGKLEGKNNLKVLDIDERIIFSVSAKKWLEFEIG
jgi:hypothetical protein